MDTKELKKLDKINFQIISAIKPENASWINHRLLNAVENINSIINSPEIRENRED